MTIFNMPLKTLPCEDLFRNLHKLFQNDQNNLEIATMAVNEKIQKEASTRNILGTWYIFKHPIENILIYLHVTHLHTQILLY
jgi:hypothetical protein